MHIAHGVISFAPCIEFPGVLNDLVVIFIVDAYGHRNIILDIRSMYAPYQVAVRYASIVNTLIKDTKALIVQ